MIKALMGIGPSRMSVSDQEDRNDMMVDAMAETRAWTIEPSGWEVASCISRICLYLCQVDIISSGRT